MPANNVNVKTRQCVVEKPLTFIPTNHVSNSDYRPILPLDNPKWECAALNTGSFFFFFARHNNVRIRTIKLLRHAPLSVLLIIYHMIENHGLGGPRVANVYGMNHCFRPRAVNKIKGHFST